jgi:hypothetical protein
MSATAPVRRPAVRRPATSDWPTSAPARKAAALPRPRLVLAVAPRTAPRRLPFLILIGAVLTGGLVAVLLLHTVAAQDAFQVTSLQQRLTVLTDEAQQQAQVVAADSGPAALRARAAALGMRPTTLGNIRRRPDGRVVGVQTPLYVAPPVVVAATIGKAAATGKNAGTTSTSTTSKTTTSTSTTTSGKATGTTSTSTGATSGGAGAKSGKPASTPKNSAPAKPKHQHHRHTQQ